MEIFKYKRYNRVWPRAIPFFGVRMTEEELYAYSKDFDLFVRKIKKLMYFHYYRYAKFVDNSPVGEGGYPDGLDCVYARHTKRLGKEEEENLAKYLRELQDSTQALLDPLLKQDETENV